MRNLKILGIAPFTSLAQNMEDIAEKDFPNIDYHGLMGDLEEGLEYAQKYEDDFDVIISRGGTAKLLKEKLSDTVVVEIPLSLFDILSSIKIAELYSSNFAFVGFKNITQQIKLLTEITEKDYDIITINHQSELTEILEKLKKKHYELIIGDNITTLSAQKYNFNTILIESGANSIKDAFNSAIEIGRIITKKNYFSDKANSICNALGAVLIELDNDFNIKFSSSELSDPLAIHIKRRLINTVTSKTNVVYTNYYNMALQLNLKQNESGYSCLMMQFENKHKDAVKDTDSKINSHKINNSSIFIGGLADNVLELAENNKNLFIYGEKGTGKKSMVKFIYEKLNEEKEVHVIDLKEVANDKQIDNLLESDNTILLDTNVAFILYNLHSFNLVQISTLLEYIEYASPNTQWILVAEENNSSTNIISYIRQLDYLTSFNLPALKERKDNIRSLIALQLYRYNAEFNKELYGFEQDGQDLIIAYDWPENMKQLKRVIKHLVINSDGKFISTEAVEKTLKQEKEKLSTYTISSASLINRIMSGETLDEIEEDIIKAVLKELGGNQTATAEALGISRTTLWRKMQSWEDDPAEN